MSGSFTAGARTIMGWIVLVVTTAVLGTYVIVASFIKPHNWHNERIIHLWARMFMALPPATLEVEGGDSLDPNETYVFVANHLSNLDVPAVLLAIPHRIRFLAKAELFRIPIFAQAMSRMGVIRTDRQAGKAAHTAINEGVTAAREIGYSLIIYPEGTRSMDGELHAFKKGAFRIAISNGLPVVPVTIEGTWEMWKPHAKLFYRGTAKVTIHDPIPVEGLTTADINRVRAEAHTAVAASYRSVRES